VKQVPAEATMRNCHGNAVGILVIPSEEDVKKVTFTMIYDPLISRRLSERKEFREAKL
jgi:hypothetical protein